MDYFNGFHVSKERAVQEAYTSVEVSLSPIEAHVGALSFDPTDKCVVIDDDFCIVMSHQKIEENIKVPFAFGYIKKSDWICDEV